MREANELLVVTKTILCQYFDRYGIPYIKNKMARELELLSDNEYLDKWQFRMESNFTFQVYQAERGEDFLEKVV